MDEGPGLNWVADAYGELRSKGNLVQGGLQVTMLRFQESGRCIPCCHDTRFIGQVVRRGIKLLVR